MKIRHNYRDQAVKFAVRGVRMTREMDNAAWRKALEIGRRARGLAPKARGDLARSIRARRLAPGRFRLIANQDYATAVERGAGPGGWPSLAAIIDWMRTRNIQPNTPGLRNERDLAFVLRRAIARRGTPAQPYMEPAADELWPQLVQQLARIAVREWAR